MERLVRVGITHGDINGIGYEVILKALADERVTELFTPVIFGSAPLVEKCRADLGIEDFSFECVENAENAAEGQINLVDIGCDGVKLTPGVSSPEAGKAAVAALEAACSALEEGKVDVIVTAPICKATANSAEFNFPGHTEYLQQRIGKGVKSLMILFDDNIRVALVTTHLPLSEIAPAITAEAVEETVRALDASLRRDFSTSRPKIAVLSLNPHCGDNGLLGSEEKTQIIPGIEKCCQEGILAFGPFAADGFFSTGAYRNFDGVVAMYHDQGLAPFKALAAEHGVNFTAGLPYVRTSPDHGTAFDIAWKGVADESSMREAIYKAVDIFRSRKRADEASANPLGNVAPEGQGRDRQQRKERQPRVAEEEKQPAGEHSGEAAPVQPDSESTESNVNTQNP